MGKTSELPVDLFLICGEKIGGSLFCWKLICGSPHLWEGKTVGEDKNVVWQEKSVGWEVENVGLLREINCCVPNLFWDGCNKMQQQNSHFGFSDRRLFPKNVILSCSPVIRCQKLAILFTSGRKYLNLCGAR